MLLHAELAGLLCMVPDGQNASTDHQGGFHATTASLNKGALLLCVLFLPKPAAAATPIAVGRRSSFFIFFFATLLVGLKKIFAGGTVLIIAFNALETFSVFTGAIRQEGGGTTTRGSRRVRRFFGLSLVVRKAVSFGIQITMNLIFDGFSSSPVDIINLGGSWSWHTAGM
jgi:hypothetical protein